MHESHQMNKSSYLSKSRLSQGSSITGSPNGMNKIASHNACYLNKDEGLIKGSLVSRGNGGLGLDKVDETTGYKSGHSGSDSSDCSVTPNSIDAIANRVNPSHVK